MIQMACPHCHVLGQIPALVLTNNQWPIACHHCHQHYFAPVVSRPDKLARHKKIKCSACAKYAQIDKPLFDQLKTENVPLFCPHCHAAMLAPKSAVVNLKQPSEIDEGRKKPSSESLFPGWQAALVLLFSGFAVTAIAIIAADEGLIDRTWLDRLFFNLPDTAVLIEGFNRFFQQIIHASSQAF